MSSLVLAATLVATQAPPVEAVRPVPASSGPDVVVNLARGSIQMRRGGTGRSEVRDGEGAVSGALVHVRAPGRLAVPCDDFLLSQVTADGRRLVRLEGPTMTSGDRRLSVEAERLMVWTEEGRSVYVVPGADGPRVMDPPRGGAPAPGRRRLR